MSGKNRKNKCDYWDCKYNQPINKARSNRRSPNAPKTSGHSKQGRRKGIQISGRCILGETKRIKLCPEEGKENEPENNM